MEGFTPRGGVSCAKPGGQNGRSCVHSQGTGMVWLRCACGSVSSAHLNGRTSTCSLPTCTCRVSHLQIKGKYRSTINDLFIHILTQVGWVQVRLLPVCVLRCALRWELLVYTLLQPEKSQRWIRLFFSVSGDSAGRGCCVPEWTITDGLFTLKQTQRRDYVRASLLLLLLLLPLVWPGGGAGVKCQPSSFHDASLIQLQMVSKYNNNF